MKKLPLAVMPLLVLILLLVGCDSSQRIELQTEVNKLREEITELETELANSKESSLPRNFNDEAELTEWREEVGIVGNELSWVDSCVLLHEIALRDGYLVTLDVDLYEDEFGVSLTVIAGERFYQTYPDKAEVYFMTFVY